MARTGNFQLTWTCCAVASPHLFVSNSYLDVSTNQLTGSVPAPLVPMFPTSSSTWSTNCITGCNNSYVGCTMVERAILVDYYLATNGPNWGPSKWLTSVTPCSWQTVTCTNNIVTYGHREGIAHRFVMPTTSGLTWCFCVLQFCVNSALSLPSNAMTGTVPASFCGLPGLVSVALKGNALAANTLNVFSCLTGLTYLAYSSGAVLAGSTIPSGISALSNLV